MDARTEEIRARVEKATGSDWSTGEIGEKGKVHGVSIWANGMMVCRIAGLAAFDYYNADFIAHARSDVPYLLTELTALREEIERLKGALRAATRCPTCEGTGKMTLECMACLSGEPGARCTCAEETCAQCDGRGWATADGTGEELVARALSPSPAQQEQKA